ncbi:MAG: hypothetical protein KKE16_01665 [Firmicutes bacterium]|nr:hypothetical protein [Bacillota bacterium]
MEENYKEKMESLKEKINQKYILNSDLNKINNEIMDIQSKLSNQSNVLYKAEVAVRNLQRISLSSFFATILNNKPEKLMKKENQLHKEKVLFEKISESIKDLEKQKNEIIKSQKKIISYEREYKILYQDKKNWVLTLDSDAAKLVKHHIDKIESIDLSIANLAKALRVGEITSSSMVSVLNELRKTSNSFHEYHSLFAEVVKADSTIPRAKSSVAAQTYLESFKKELESVGSEISHLFPDTESTSRAFEVFTDKDISYDFFRTNFVAQESSVIHILNSVDAQTANIKYAITEMKKIKDSIERHTETLVTEF